MSKRDHPLFFVALCTFLCSSASLAQNPDDVFPGFRNQSVYEPYIQYYTDPNSPDYVRGSDPILIRAILKLETAGVPWQRSSANALGPAQLLLSTARNIDPDATRDKLLFDIGYSIKLMAIHTVDLTEQIRQAFRRNRKQVPRVIPGSIREKELVLAAYNSGILNVERYKGIPSFPETRAYVRRGIHLYREFLAQERRR